MCLLTLLYSYISRKLLKILKMWMYLKCNPVCIYFSAGRWDVQPHWDTRLHAGTVLNPFSCNQHILTSAHMLITKQFGFQLALNSSVYYRHVEQLSLKFTREESSLGVSVNTFYVWRTAADIQRCVDLYWAAVSFKKLSYSTCLTEFHLSGTDEWIMQQQLDKSGYLWSSNPENSMSVWKTRIAHRGKKPLVTVQKDGWTWEMIKVWSQSSNTGTGKAAGTCYWWQSNRWKCLCGCRHLPAARGECHITSRALSQLLQGQCC